SALGSLFASGTNHGAGVGLHADPVGGIVARGLKIDVLHLMADSLQPLRAACQRLIVGHRERQANFRPARPRFQRVERRRVRGDEVRIDLAPQLAVALTRREAWRKPADPRDDVRLIQRTHPGHTLAQRSGYPRRVTTEQPWTVLALPAA